MVEKNIIITKQKVFKFIIQLLLVAAAGVIGGVTFKSFFEELEPSIIPTGLSGFAMIIRTWLSWGGIDIATSIIYLALNVVIFAFSLKYFGWKFLVFSGVGMGTYVLGMEYGFIEAILQSVGGNDHLLLCIVGSIIMGLMTGIAIRMGGSTGGSDILGKLLNRAFPKIKTGWCILIINVIVLSLSIVTSGLQTGLYALVNSIVSSLATDMVLDRSKKIVAYYIICDKPKEIADAILSHYHRGVTQIDGTGMFTGNNKSILLCLVPYDQSYKMREFVLSIDKNAFVFSTPVTQTIGENNLMTAPLPAPVSQTIKNNDLAMSESHNKCENTQATPKTKKQNTTSKTSVSKQRQTSKQTIKGSNTTVNKKSSSKKTTKNAE